MSIEIRKIGITKLDTDCIVNAANQFLREGGGVCGAIFREAGSREMQKACDRFGGCAVGQAVVTPGFRLPAKYVIHAVGPMWRDGRHGEREQLYSCYQSSMRLALENGCRSIAFPLISAGIFGYPKEEAWEVAVSAISDFNGCRTDGGLEVVMAVLDDEMLEMGRNALERCGMQERQKQAVFFWREDGENGCFSQWYRARFTIEGIEYRFAEQYMMARKALLFEDYKMYVLIMSADAPGQCKKYGKDVRNYDDARWKSCREEIVYHANLAKFSQNPELREALMRTGDRILAEASPLDAIWGIGLSADKAAACEPSRWPGKNLLGQALMKVREDLKGK